MIWVLSTLIIVICLAVLSVSVVLLLALRTPGEGATTVPTTEQKCAVESPFYDGGHQTSQHNLNKHKYHDLNKQKYHYLNEHRYHDLYKTKYHYLYKHKYHNLNKYYNTVEYYFHRTANFSGTTNSNCSIRR
ncbi:hypothetical protein MTO96_028718 [Rhipicephalus appendiculatus]